MFKNLKNLLFSLTISLEKLLSEKKNKLVPYGYEGKIWESNNLMV